MWRNYATGCDVPSWLLSKLVRFLYENQNRKDPHRELSLKKIRI
jgi:hypothetical protein